MSTPDSTAFDRPTPVSLDTWRARVDADLKGASFARKHQREIEPGVVLPSLNTAEDAVDHGLPGQAPYVRGTKLAGGWWTATRHELGADDLGAHLARDVSRGVELLVLGGTDARARWPGALDGLEGSCGLAFEPGALGLAEASALLTTPAHAARPLLALGLDPQAAAWGGTGTPVSTGDVVAAAQVATNLPGDQRAWSIDTGWLHGAGATDVLDLATALSHGVHALRTLTDAGLDLGQAAGQLVFHLRVGPAFFQGIAKLRAFRGLWARVLEASGDVDAARSLVLMASLGERHLTLRDPWVNALRNTAAVFAGAMGGATAVLSRAHDALEGGSTAGRRLARNASLMLRDESHLGRVVDPAGGSWTIEQLTAQLAEAAWRTFQQLEAQGGIEGVLASGELARRTDDAWAERERALDKRKTPITGVSEFPLLDERSTPADVESTGPFPLRRWSRGYEHLRDRADLHLAATGQRPRVFLANLGPIARHTGRATWIANLLAAGGIEAVGNDGFDSPEAAAEAFTRSGCSLACLCGADRDYAELAEPVARALKAAGTATLLLAGRPGDHEASWKAAGIDRFVFLGIDVRAELTTLLDQLAPLEAQP